MASLLRPELTLRRYIGMHASHSHAHAQLLFGLQGRLELELDGRGARVDRSSGLIVPPGTAHAYEAAQEARVWVLDVPAALAVDRVRRFALPPRWQPTDDIQALLSLAGTAPVLRARRGIDPLQLEQAMAGRLHEDWPNSRMAAVFALSAPRFHARWLALTAQTPQAWLRGRRLEHAQRLLRAGLTLEVAALHVGYASASALAFALRRERGIGARALRSRRA